MGEQKQNLRKTQSMNLDDILLLQVSLSSTFDNFMALRH